MHSKVRFTLLSLFVAGPLLVAAGCGMSDVDGTTGAAGPAGTVGAPGTTGNPGTSGTPFIKVTPAQLGIWKLLGANTATAAITADNVWPLSALGGTGSVRLFPGTGKGVGGDWPAWSGSGGKAFIGTAIANGLALADLTALSYSAYNVNAGSALVMPYVNVFIDLDGDGVFDKTKDEILSFDPSYFPATAAAPAMNDRWQNWDAATGKSWRCVFGKARIDAAGTACTTGIAYGWNELVNNNTAARVVPASCQEVPFPVASAQNTCATPDRTAPGLLFVVGQKSGDQFDKYTGYLDNVRLGVQGFAQTYNFETQ